jgi:hypothetical protein
LRNKSHGITKDQIPKGKRILPSRFVYRKKFNKLAEVLKYKVRLVAKGFKQILGVDFFATFAPVAQLTALRLLLIICAQFSLITFHIDFEQAFVQSDIDTEIYMSYPEGFKRKNKKGETLYMKLKKSLYGLKQAPRNWNVKLTAWLLNYGFVQSKVDPCFFYYLKDGIKCYINVYVDDVPGGHNNPKWFAKFVKDLKADFKVGEICDLEWVMQVEIKKIKDGYQFCHKKYINDLLRKFKMQDCKPQKVPLDPSFDISSADSPETPEEKAKMADSGYRELLGSLLWIARVDRPDIQAAISILARFASNPSERHLKALRGVLRYLSATKELGTCFTKVDPRAFKLVAYSDSDWAGDKDTRHSTTGYVLFLGNSPVCWYSGKQGLVSTSTTEAEYVAMSMCAKEVCYMRNLLESIGLSQESTLFYGDNQGALFLGDNPKTAHRTKHISIKFHHIRELTHSQIINLQYLETDRMVADLLTKPLTYAKLSKLLKQLLNMPKHSS